MIWSVVTKSEMEGYAIPKVFHHYQEALGRDNISLAVVNENDPLDFVNPETDVVLLRTASKNLIGTIHGMGVRSTAETFDKYVYASDKAFLSAFLKCKGILTPNQYHKDEIFDGRKYFVKPKFGSESFGISEKSICSSKKEILERIDFIKRELHSDSVIEEFIDGTDCTVSCYVDHDSNEIRTHAIEVECQSNGGIQTFEGKTSYDEFCVAMTGIVGNRICDISRKVFQLLELKHHARFDFRKPRDGRLYLIDANLIPGLSPLGDFAKCLLLTANMSYIDSLRAIINSSTIHR